MTLALLRLRASVSTGAEPAEGCWVVAVRLVWQALPAASRKARVR